MMDENVKYCPLFLQSQEGVKTSLMEEWNICLKEHCAWWDEERQKCAVAVLPPRR